MDNADTLRRLLTDLNRQLTAINSNPVIPGSVKLAVDTTFQIMEILVYEAVKNG